MAETASFNGFSNLRVGVVTGSGSQTYNLNGIDRTSSGRQNYSLGNAQQVDIAHVSGNGSFDPDRVSFSFDINDSFDPIPEPLSALFIGLSGMVFVLRRRR